MNLRKPTWQIVLYVLIICGLAYLYLSGLGFNLSHEDEGTFLYQAWRVSEGETLYEDFYTSRWPLFIYTGALLINWLGVVVTPIRLISIGLTFGTALLIPLIMGQIVGKDRERPEFMWIALLASAAYLLNPAVIENSRYFITEPFYIFFGTLAFYAFLRTYKDPNRWWLLLPAALFTISAMYKVLGNLIIAGCFAHLAGQWLMQPKRRWELWRTIWTFALFYLACYGLALGTIAILLPNFVEGVLGANFADNAAEVFSLSANANRVVSYLRRFVTVTFAPILIILWRYIPLVRQYDDIGAAGWQLPTVLGFLILSRKIFIRLFVYLNPFIAILFGVALIQLSRNAPRQFRVSAWVTSGLIALVALIFWPPDYFVVQDGTTRIVERIQEETHNDALVISDYQMHNYLAERNSTFQGAEISSVIIRNGVVTTDDVIGELKADDVELIILDQDGSHYLELPEFERLEAYIEENYVLEEVLPDHQEWGNNPEFELRARMLVDYLALTVAGIDFEYTERYYRRARNVLKTEPNIEIWIREE